MTGRVAAGDGRNAGDLVFLQEEFDRFEEIFEGLRRSLLPEIHQRLRAPVEYALSTSGKRLRPILCVLGYSASRTGNELVPDALYRLACAVEIVHTYSLVHDDLPCMDDDDLRRGRPTVHRVFTTAEATLAGAALIPVAMKVLDQGARDLGLPTAVRAQLVVELASASGAAGMVGGQVMDLEGEARRLTAPMLESVHRRKTGALLASSIRLGAMAGGASDQVLADLSRYGHALGLAFQIADDLLDVEGRTDALGKIAGRDIALGKSSYPSLHGVEGARRLARETVEEAKEAVRHMAEPRLREIADYVIERGR